MVFATIISVLIVISVVQSKTLFTGLGQPIKYIKCDNPASSAQVTLVQIAPCDQQPCILHRGSSADFEIDFIPAAATKTLKSVVKGKIGVLWVPFPLDHDDACQGSGLTCPLVAGQSYKFNYSLPIKTSYPPIKLLVSWELIGDDNSEVVCIEFPVQLQ